MDERNRSELEADAINDRMAAEIEQRRRQMPNQRRQSKAPAVERRKICAYCFQRGDHPTAAHCMRALERGEGLAESDA
jgi:hypothetical protein